MANLKKSSVGENNAELEQVVSQIEEENLRTLNDTYEMDEDGYVHDVPLLAGYLDKDGVLHDTFTYREMNGKDEEALNKGDVRTNGAKVVNVLVERCVTKIGSLHKKDHREEWGKIIREMLGGDLDYMAFKIREISKGNEVEFTHKCPECGTKLTTIVGTEEFGIKYFKGQREISFELVRGYKDAKGGIHKDGVIRIPNGLDREVVTPLFKKNPSTATTLLLTRLISFNDGCMINQNLVNNMSLRDRDILEKIVSENVFGVDTNIEITCSSCGADISGEIGQSNFL